MQINELCTDAEKDQTNPNLHRVFGFWVRIQVVRTYRIELRDSVTMNDVYFHLKKAQSSFISLFPSFGSLTSVLLGFHGICARQTPT